MDVSLASYPNRPDAVSADSANVPPHRPSLRRNISWTLAGNITYAGCQWGILIAIARLGSPEMVGQFALVMAVATPVFMFANLNLRYVQVTDVLDRYRPQDYVSLRLLTSACAFLVLLAVGLCSSDMLAVGLVVASVACMKASESVSDVLHGIQHKRERMRAINIARAVRGVLSLVVVTILLATTGSLSEAMIGLAVVNTFVLLAIDIPTATTVADGPSDFHPFAFHLRVGTLCQLAWISLPVGLGSAMLSLNLNLPRYFIAHYLDTTLLGQYAAAAYLLVATDMVVRSARITALPRLARLFAEDRIAEFCWLTWRLMLLGFASVLPFLILVWIGGGTFLAWIYGPDYRNVADVFFWLMVANLIWQSSVPTAVLWALHRYWTDLALRVATTFVIALAALLLIPRHGLIGAAWSMVAGRSIASLGTACAAALVLRRSRSQGSLPTPNIPNKISQTRQAMRAPCAPDLV
jgi:O-antigen/teichoic acid export membrane protein